MSVLRTKGISKQQARVSCEDIRKICEDIITSRSDHRSAPKTTSHSNGPLDTAGTESSRALVLQGWRHAAVTLAIVYTFAPQHMRLVLLD